MLKSLFNGCRVGILHILILFAAINISQAQSRIYGGISFPLGPFSSTDLVSGGFARTGFSGGAEATTKFFLNSEIGISGIICYHPFDAQILLAKIMEKSLQIPAGSTIKADPWLLLWPMGSLGYSFPTSERVTIYGRGHGGLLYGVCPEVTVDEFGAKFSQNMAIKITFGWGVGAGILLNKKLDFGIRYMVSEPEYEINNPGGGVFTEGRSRYVTKTLLFLIGIGL